MLYMRVKKKDSCFGGNGAGRSGIDLSLDIFRLVSGMAGRAKRGVGVVASPFISHIKAFHVSGRAVWVFYQDIFVISYQIHSILYEGIRKIFSILSLFASIIYISSGLPFFLLKTGKKERKKRMIDRKAY